MHHGAPPGPNAQNCHPGSPQASEGCCRQDPFATRNIAYKALVHDRFHTGSYQWNHEVEVLPQSIPQNLKTQEPLAFAKHLAGAATPNKDQKGIARLVVDAMEKAWLHQGKPETLKRHGAILRLLLVGGGGCCKSCIINLVLMILLREN